MTIEICLPGQPRTTAVDIGDYRITVERLDGIACSEIEARTAMAMYSIQRAPESQLNKKRPRTNEQLEAAAVTAFFG